MSCQIVGAAGHDRAQGGQGGPPVRLNIGLLCSKTFDDAIFEELFEAKYGLKKADIKKMNIKGVFQIWMHDGDYHEVPLKECHAWTREGCKLCPDFAAEHADISTGGIGKFNDWTLTVVRTDLAARSSSRCSRTASSRAARRRRPRRHRPHAQALDQEPQALARLRSAGAEADRGLAKQR